MRTEAIQSDERSGGGISLFWKVALAVHLAALVYGLAAHELLAASTAASLALFTIVWYAVARGALAALSLTLACIAGNVAAFAYANLAYVEFTELPQGQHHEVTAWFTALLCWCAVLGALGAHRLLGPDDSRQQTELIQRWQTLALAAVIFIAFAIVFVSSGILNARWEVRETTSLEYLAHGASILTYVVFFLLGTRMKGALLAPRNLAIVVVVGGVAFLQGLSGGREPSIWMCIFLLVGASTGTMSRRTLLTLAAASSAVVVVFVTVLGQARVNKHFAFGSIDDRTSSMAEAAHASFAGDGKDADPLTGFAERFFEMSAQDVIDQTLVTHRFAGFEHVERLKYIFIPRALAPDKPDPDDGLEILIRDFGYEVLPGTGVPLPLVADAFRRGGVLWVAVVGLCVGAWLRVLVRLTFLVAGSAFAPLALGMLSVTYFRSYPYGVLGTVDMFTYAWVKINALVIGFLWMARLLILLTERVWISS
jgi:hypothetical protein